MVPRSMKKEESVEEFKYAMKSLEARLSLQIVENVYCWCWFYWIYDQSVYAFL